MSVNLEPIRQVIDQTVTGLGIDLEACDIAQHGRRWILDVVVDQDGGIDLDAIAALSTALSAALDPLDSALPDGYVLQVGSPGVDRPLTLERHWRRAAGRLVQVHPKRSDMFTDRVIAVRDGSVEFASHDACALDELDHGFVQIEFTRLEDGDGH
jgi:ribosome maturation factor RimP